MHQEQSFLLFSVLKGAARRKEDVRRNTKSLKTVPVIDA